MENLHHPIGLYSFRGNQIGAVMETLFVVASSFMHGRSGLISVWWHVMILAQVLVELLVHVMETPHL